MEQSPSLETDSHSASQEIPHLLWNPKVHYRFRKILQILSPCRKTPFFFTVKNC